MRARRYNKRIEVWQTVPLPEDELGDNDVTEQLITNTWCQIITLDKPYRATEFGIIDTTDTIVIRLRKRNDLPYNSQNQFFIYRNNRYQPQTEPVNVGFEDREIQITLKRESSKNANTLTPIGGGFPYTFPFKLA